MTIFHSDFIGFSVHTTSTQNPSDGQIILFDGVWTNVGSAYDSTTSIFTCPTSAYYYIYTHIRVGLDSIYSACDFQIRLDDVVMVEV